MRKYENAFILKNINLLDLTKSESKKTNVYVEDGVITNISPSLDLSTGFQEINGRDKFLLAGLIDLRVQLGSEPKQIGNNLTKILKSGVTTIRDISEPTNLPKKLSRDLEKGLISSPKVIFSGPIIRFGEQKDSGTIIPAHFSKNKIEDLIWKMIENGLEHFSIEYRESAVKLEQLETVINTANRYNKKIFLFVTDQQSLAKVENLAVNCLENISSFSGEGNKKVKLMPLLGSKVEEKLNQNLSFVAGSGFGFASNELLIEELKRYQKQGMSTNEILKSATVNSAKLLGLEQEIGSIEIGKKADLLILSKNPLADIENLESIETVFKNGKSHA